VWKELLRYHYVRGLHRGWGDRDRWAKDVTPAAAVVTDADTSHLRVDPYLHVGKDQIYSPILDRSLRPPDPGYREVVSILQGRLTLADVPAVTTAALQRTGWLVADEPGLANRFRLKYVALEAHTVCNQACYFCPVSIAPRERHFMPDELYARIVQELTDYRETIEAVFMINYNEPTADRRFVEQVRTLKTAGLRPAVLTNGSGLTPDRVDAIVTMGGLRFLSVNLSTLDRQRYAADRGVDQLDLVLRNLDYAKDRPVAAETDLVVLGQGDDHHRQDFEDIRRRFAGSRFNVKYFEVMDRTGHIPLGLRPPAPHAELCGCDNVGSRPLQHLHITPHGQCALCCEDYSERYLVGDLTKESLAEVLTGPAFAQMRRWVYGLETAPADFICRRCVFARTR
jgi:radical SAM family protein/iron-sulfur cluster protein